MIEHVVLLRPAPDTTAAAIAEAGARVKALVEQIVGLQGVAWGPNVSPEGLGHGYDIGFVMTFADARSRDAYLGHAAHLPVAALLQELTTDVLVFDVERDPST